jgi:hypothetical protein
MTKNLKIYSLTVWCLQDTENNPPVQEAGTQQLVDQVFFSDFVIVALGKITDL